MVVVLGGCLFIDAFSVLLNRDFFGRIFALDSLFGLGLL